MDLSEYDESMKVGEMEIHHFSHPQHPLLFISDPAEDDQVIEPDYCSACDESLDDGSRYGCKECKYYLHKQCAELVLAPQIDHPFHHQHLLTLLPKSPYDDVKNWCNFCDETLSGFVYHCASCDRFDLHVKCSLLQSSIAPIFPNSLHQHPLFFVRNHNYQLKKDCSGCMKPLSGPIYHCSICSSNHYFNLHKECAELSLEINHPFHPQHLLTLLPKSPYGGMVSYKYPCDFCDQTLSGFIYHCDPCKFDLHMYCALLQSSIAPKFPTSLHKHPLVFVQNHKDQVKKNCSGCMKPLFGPIYHCSGRSYLPKLYRSCFDLHKECSELPLEINHPYDRKHPLNLLPNPPSHPRNCSCYLCKIKWKGFVYSCSLCNFHLTPEDVSAPRTITKASHQHPWMLISRKMSFTCDFCGTIGDRTPYLCATCDLLVHRNCTSLPLKIIITRHHHVICHSYSLPQNQLEEMICRICYEEVDTQYGSYYCSHSYCNYIAHPLCATDKNIWDGTIIPDDYDESLMEALLQPSNMITVVFEQMDKGEQMVAIEIKHAFHDHNLRLISSYEIKDDGVQCDGCMSPISSPFYSCDQCKFRLHKVCAELPRGKRHPFHKHLLTLSNLMKVRSLCRTCKSYYDGFHYICDNKDWFYNCADCDNSLHSKCALGDPQFRKLGEKFRRTFHPHPLTLVKNIWICPPCKVCSNLCNGLALECKESKCNFAVHWECS